MRTLGRDRLTIPARGRLRIRLQPQPLPLVLGRAPAPTGRRGRHTRAAILAPADQQVREVALRLLSLGLHGGEVIVADKGYVGRELAAAVRERHGALILRPKRKDEPGHGVHLAPIRQYIESIFWALRDRVGLERHNTRTLHGLRARFATKLLALAAGVWLNHYLNRPSRTFTDLSR